MKTIIPFVTSLSVLLIAPDWGAAETVIALASIELKDKPGEQGWSVARAPEGESLSVLRRRGRWLLVKYKGRKGWVTRTSTSADEASEELEASVQKSRRASDDEPDAGESAATGKSKRSRPQEKRSSTGWTKDRIRDALEVEVIAKRVQAYNDPRRRGKSVFEVEMDDEVSVIGNSANGWFLIENEAGDIGWIPKAATRDPFSSSDSSSAADSSTTAKSKPRKNRIVTPPESDKRGGIRARGSVVAGVDSFGILQEEAGILSIAYSSSVGASVALAYQRPSYEISVFGEALSNATPVSMEEVSSTETREESIGLRSGRAGAALSVGGRLRGIAKGGYAIYELLPLEPDTSLQGWRIAGFYAGLGGAFQVSEKISAEAGVESLLGGRRATQNGEEETITGQELRSATGAIRLRLTRHLRAALDYRVGQFESELEGMPVTSHVAHTLTLGMGFER